MFVPHYKKINGLNYILVNSSGFEGFNVEKAKSVKKLYKEKGYKIRSITNNEGIFVYIHKADIPDVMKAREFGKKAFKDGKHPIPAQNKDLMNLIGKSKESIMLLMSEFVYAWHEENLK
jgi:hypothetical protein